MSVKEFWLEETLLKDDNGKPVYRVYTEAKVGAIHVTDRSDYPTTIDITPDWTAQRDKLYRDVKDVMQVLAVAASSNVLQLDQKVRDLLKVTIQRHKDYYLTKP